MGRLIAIGGGEIGRPGFSMETISIDKEIIRLTGKTKPRLLFLPTAAGDSALYGKVVEKYFGKKLGCTVNILSLYKNPPPQKIIREKLLSADIIYVGGGNTFRMLRIWKKRGLNSILKEAHKKGIVLAGVSAGAVCWFRYANSDSRKMNNPKADYIKVSGLNYVPALLCPHYDVEKGRKPALKKMMKKTPGVAIALDNCAAIECIDETYRILTSKKTANAYKVFWKDGKYHHIELSKEKTFLPLSELLKK